MKKGVFYSHQGWTDIISCLALINIYAKQYDELIVVMRDDANSILDYYIKGLNNVKMLYVPKHILDTQVLNIGTDWDILFHGFHDRFRRDKYQNAFSTKFDTMFYGKGFYEFYDIDSMEKINSFELQRDSDLEESKYLNFIKTVGTDYIVYHDDQNSPGGNTGINLTEMMKSIPNSINLNRLTSNIFDFLKILENAKEIHLVDSIWGMICYLMDSKYKIFADKNVFLYTFKDRSGGLLPKYEDTLIEPFHPDNWIIKQI